MSDVFTEGEYLGAKRKEFQRDLVGAVYGVKQYINDIREDYKGARLKPSSITQVKLQIEHKKRELETLISNLKDKFSQVSQELKEEAAGLRYDLSDSKDQLADILGFEDQVRGFDMEMETDDNLDFLDIYSEFLGDEYHRMKESY